MKRKGGGSPTSHGFAGDSIAATKNVRLEATKIHSLPTFMNQGGDASHQNAGSLPELLDQHGSTKNGVDNIHPRGLKTLMDQ